MEALFVRLLSALSPVAGHNTCAVATGATLDNNPTVISCLLYNGVCRKEFLNYEKICPSNVVQQQYSAVVRHDYVTLVLC